MKPMSVSDVENEITNSYSRTGALQQLAEMLQRMPDGHVVLLWSEDGEPRCLMVKSDASQEVLELAEAAAKLVPVMDADEPPQKDSPPPLEYGDWTPTFGHVPNQCGPMESFQKGRWIARFAAKGFELCTGEFVVVRDATRVHHALDLIKWADAWIVKLCRWVIGTEPDWKVQGDFWSYRGFVAKWSGGSAKEGSTYSLFFEQEQIIAEDRPGLSLSLLQWANAWYKDVVSALELPPPGRFPWARTSEGKLVQINPDGNKWPRPDPSSWVIVAGQKGPTFRKGPWVVSDNPHEWELRVGDFLIAWTTFKRGTVLEWGNKLIGELRENIIGPPSWETLGDGYWRESMGKLRLSYQSLHMGERFMAYPHSSSSPLTWADEWCSHVIAALKENSNEDDQKQPA